MQHFIQTLSIFLFVVYFTVKVTDSCAATSSTTTPVTTTIAVTTTTTTVATTAACQSCTLATAPEIQVSVATKDFTSDTIDNSGTCATRTAVCDSVTTGGDAMIALNRDANGVVSGTDTASVTLTCNDSGQWVLQGVVITAIECEGN